VCIVLILNMSELKRLPINLTLTWHSGTKSFAEIYSNPLHTGKQRIDEWREAPRGEQLGEDVMKLLFYKAIDLANKWPDRHVGFVRYDIDSLPETPNNAPFRGDMVKEIVYDGYVYKSTIGGSNNV